MKMRLVAWTMIALVAAGSTAPAAAANSGVSLKTICRVKGQEENTLQGLGIVVGLKGTGDGGSSLPTLRFLAQAMQNLGNPLGKTGLAELKDAKNVALVYVTATVPASGARQGDKLDCVVSSAGGAKSLAGGRLLLTPLVGPSPKEPRVYALAEGPITLDSANLTTTGRIHRGCRMEEDLFNVFLQDGKFTLVLDRNYADFQIASEVATTINTSKLNPSYPVINAAAGLPSAPSRSGGNLLAKAISPNNVEVTIPPDERDPVEFISLVLGLTLLAPQTGPRVVVNERGGSIVIDGDVEIGPVVINHKNIVVEAGSGNPAAHFVPFDPGNEAPTLKALVAALDALRVPTEDMIQILKDLERSGRLRAQLIIE